MPLPLSFHRFRVPKKAKLLTLALAIACCARYAFTQQMPLISGGAGFLSSTNGGSTSYLPIYEPLIAAPLVSHLLVESRGVLVEAIFPDGKGGYDHSRSFGLT